LLDKTFTVNSKNSGDRRAPPTTNYRKMPNLALAVMKNPFFKFLDFC